MAYKILLNTLDNRQARKVSRELATEGHEVYALIRAGRPGKIQMQCSLLLQM
ncbi:MAG: hypothetical protein IJ833_10540 [Lachnospiraceae bacterium]|nr:hypothetical protein [Lachnospiraceae bacterium]